MRSYSLSYLTANGQTPPDMVSLAARHGYRYVGLRLLPNAPGAPQQFMIGQPAVLAETRARMGDTGVGVFDLEIIRIGEGFDLNAYKPLMEVGAALGARSLLVAGDDEDASRLAAHYAQVCELAATYQLNADLEFMPWTAVRTASDALAVIRAAGSPAAAGVLVDALHVARSGTTVEDIAAIPRALLHYAQICDAPALTPATHAEMIYDARENRQLPGEGGIALAPLFAALPADLPIAVEVPNFKRVATLGEDAWAGMAMAAAQAVLDQAVATR